MRRLLLVLVTTVIAASSAAAQEVGIYSAAHSVSLEELQDLRGYGGHALLFTPGLNVRFSIYSQSATTVKDSRTCHVIFPPSNCTDETVTRESRLRGVILAAAVPIMPQRQLQFELGAGASFNLLDASDSVPSGRRSPLITSDGGQLGALFTAGVRLQPLRSVPVVLHALGGSHFIRMTACGEYAWNDDPFCGIIGVHELRLGIGYLIRHGP
ncbi:MAG TPA: hypothetical protein VK929_02875 [Longimicrobiales bacterium]|nr:hypothetical protein [Longimicrobiales bacterium]